VPEGSIIGFVYVNKHLPLFSQRKYLGEHRTLKLYCLDIKAILLYRRALELAIIKNQR